MGRSEDHSSSKKDPVFAVAAAYNVFVSLPALLQSLCGLFVVDDPILQFVFPDERDRQSFVESPVARLYLEVSLSLVLLFGVGYWRLYQDGAERQPLILALGCVGKMAVVSIFARCYFQGTISDGSVVIGILPDLLAGLYFLKEWARHNFIMVAATTSTEGGLDDELKGD
jgi:hypothetical protein